MLSRFSEFSTMLKLECHVASVNTISRWWHLMFDNKCILIDINWGWLHVDYN